MNFITGHGMLVFPASDPIAVRSVLPHAKSLEYRGKPHIAVRHDLDAVTILRNIGINAPSPVNHGWDYPGRYKPWDHQKAATEFWTTTRRGFDLSEMGVGKSKSALWAAEYLMRQGWIKRVVIVCPKSCTHKVWEDEIFQTVMHRSAVVIEGSRERKLELAASASDYLIVNHDGLATISSVLAKDTRIGLYVYDEASAIRNSMTDRYKTLKSLLKPATRLWMLTGSPCPNAPTDAWALARLVRPETVPPYFLAFKRQTMIQVSNFKWVPKPESAQMAYAALQPAIRFKTADCHDLPPVTYQNRACDLSPEQHRMMEQMRKHLVADNDGATITAANAAVKMVKLLQLCGGTVMDDEGQAQVIGAPDRVAAVRDVVEESEHKVIVWCPFKKAMEYLKTELSTDWKCAIINGDVGARERAEIITEFQDASSELKVLIAHPATAAHGLTLVTANVCVWYGPTFSAELDSQANARMIRPGQKHHMTVVRLGASPIEWEAYNVAQTKSNRQEAVLQLYRKLASVEG
jgi:SNF2 family DNA or RNA helicase